MLACSQIQTSGGLNLQDLPGLLPEATDSVSWCDCDARTCDTNNKRIVVESAIGCIVDVYRINLFAD